MKKTMILLFFLLFIGQLVRAGDQIQVAPFHSIIVSSGIEAELVLEKKEAVQADFEGAPEESMIVEVVDSVLKVRMKTGKYKDSKLKLRIYYAEDLRMMEANGRAQIWSEEDLYFDGSLTTKLFNGGEMRFTLYCDSLSSTVTQGAIIHLKGETQVLDVKANTGATFSGYEFNSQAATVNATGGGKAKVSVQKELKANASAKGFIGYVGDPKVEKKNKPRGRGCTDHPGIGSEPGVLLPGFKNGLGIDKILRSGNLDILGVPLNQFYGESCLFDHGCIIGKVAAILLFVSLHQHIVPENLGGLYQAVDIPVQSAASLRCKLAE